MCKNILSTKSFMTLLIIPFVMISGMLIAMVDMASYFPQFLSGGLLLLLLFPWFINSAIRKKRLDVFEPIYIFVFTIFIHFLLPVFSFLSPNSTYPSPLVNKALLLVALTVLSFYGGYYLVSSSPPPLMTKTKSYSIPLIFIASLTLLIISMLAEFRMLSAIGGISSLLILMRNRLDMFTYISGVTLTLIRLSRPSFYILLLAASVKKKWRLKLLLPLIITGISAISVGVFTGNRGEFISPLLVLLIFTYYRQQKIKNIYLIGFGVVAIAFLPLYLIFVRSPNMQTDLRGIDTVATIQYLWDDSVGQGTFMEIRSVMDVIRGMPEKLNYQLGRTYFSLTTYFIPRSVFPNKMPEAAEIFGLAFYPERWLAGRGGARVSMIGEFYMNFWIFGIVIGSSILGRIMRRLYHMLPQSNDLSKLLLYAITLSAFYFFIRGNFAGVTTRFLTDWLPIWFILLFATQQTRQKSMHPPIVKT